MMNRLCALILLLNWIPLTPCRRQPFKQPFCEPHPESFYFYNHHINKMHKYKTWFCLESFEEKIKLCAEMYAMSAEKEVASFQMPNTLTDDGKEDEAIEIECERRITWWYEPIESSLEDLLFSQEEDKPKERLGVDMFKCPITRMNVTLKGFRPCKNYMFEERPKPKKGAKKKLPTVYDFYMAIGRNLITVAVMTDSLEGDNICIKDIHYYPKAQPKIDACFLEDIDWGN